MMPALTGQRREVLVVGVGDMKASADPSQVIVTHALGSCLGIVLYDRALPAAGMLHAMLPEAAALPDRARQNPLMFVDTGLPALFREMYALGASKARIELSVVGGACMGADPTTDWFQIGRQNIAALAQLLSRNGVRVRGHLIAGRAPRNVSVRVADGVVRVTTGAIQTPLEEADGAASVRTTLRAPPLMDRLDRRSLKP